MQSGKEPITVVIAAALLNSMLCWLSFRLGENTLACEKGKVIDYGGAQVDVRSEADVCVGDVHRVSL